MPKALPPRPNLDWLKKTAKERLAALRERDSAARLHDAQHALANDYGFKGWRALKAAVDARSIDGQIVAAASGKARELAALLAAHPKKLTITGGNWQRPLLHLAAEGGHLGCVEVLLKAGFDVGKRDRLDKATALHWAAQGGHIAVVKRLVEAGADVDGDGDAHAMGVIGWAACFNQTHGEVAEFLLAHGAKPHILAAVSLNRGDLVRRLLEHDPKLLETHKMSRFEHHRTPLQMAVIKNRPAMVKLLLEHGADPAVKDSRGYTALNFAGKTTDPAIAAMLIADGAKPSEQNVNRFENMTPILNVKDVSASIDYYVEKLGFELRWDWGSPPGFACVGRDAVQIFLCRDAQGAPGTWIAIWVQDVDALYEDYKKSGAIIRQKPTNFPWGAREMNVQDLDGHRLRVSASATGPSDGVDLDEGP
jgi:ankyrin repeat protein